MPDDLMDNFNKTNGVSTADPADGTNTGHIPEIVTKRGDNMLDSATKSVPSPVDETTDTPTIVEDPTPEAAAAVSDSDTWTKDSALKEVKKLRHENKKYREKYEERIAKLSLDSDSRITAKEQEVEHLIQKAKKLDELEAAAEDKKRNLEEKVSHRDIRINELQDQLNGLQSGQDNKVVQLENEIQTFRAEQEARIAIAQEALVDEMKTIPDKFKAQAEIFIKGAGNPSEALTALREAKLSGLFAEKAVYVNNAVPNADTGARTSKEQLEATERERRSKMSSDEKIKEGLRQAFTTGNSAVKLR